MLKICSKHKYFQEASLDKEFEEKMVVDSV